MDLPRYEIPEADQDLLETGCALTVEHVHAAHMKFRSTCPLCRTQAPDPRKLTYDDLIDIGLRYGWPKRTLSVLRLRKEKLPYKEIGRRHGLSDQWAQVIISTCLHKAGWLLRAVRGSHDDVYITLVSR